MKLSRRIAPTNKKKSSGNELLLARVRDCLANERYTEANRICNQILAGNPHNPNALVLAGIALTQLGEKDKALEQFRKAVSQKPNDATILYNYGFALQNAGRLEEAVAIYEQALTVNPACANTLHNLATIYFNRGQKQRACDFYERATAISRNPLTYFNLGLIYCERYQIKDALAMFDKALACDPNFSAAKAYIGSIYRLLGLNTQAINYLAEAYALNPKSFEVCTELGNSYSQIQDFEKADYYFTKAIPNDSLQEFTGKINISIIKILLHQYDQAEECVNSIVMPTDVPKIDHLETLIAVKLNLSLKSCNWNEYDKNINDFRELFTTMFDKLENVTTEPFVSLRSIADPEHNYNVAVLYSKKYRQVASQFVDHAEVDGKGFFRQRQEVANSGRKLKIGYVSADFNSHPCMHAIKGVLQNHNQQQFDIHFFDISIKQETSEHEFLQQQGTLHQLTPFSDFDAARYIHDQQIDILVDMMGHTVKTRLGIFSFKPAPVQITYLGYPGTTGTDFMDYIIGDRTVIPEEEKRYYSEEVLYLSQCYLPSNDQEIIADHRYSKEDFGIDEKAFVFCSFNQMEKITPGIFRTWMEILQAVPNSVIMLSNAFPEREKFCIANLRKEANNHGVSQERLVFAQRVPSRALHLARIKHVADLALDTTVYNGHSTTSEILWAGAPVITIKGTNFPSRVSESILNELGLPELVTQDHGEYKKLAVKFAEDPEFRRMIREKISVNKKTSKFFNSKHYTTALESLYLAAWSRCEQTSA